jgi:hypothetical protein
MKFIILFFIFIHTIISSHNTINLQLLEMIIILLLHNNKQELESSWFKQIENSIHLSENWIEVLGHMSFLDHLQRCSVCDPVKIFFISKFSYVLLCNPTNKTETGTANNRWGGLLIANHTDQSLRWANQKHWASVRSYLLHSFLQVQVGFSSSIFTVQDHILSTIGDSLR